MPRGSMARPLVLAGLVLLASCGEPGTDSSGPGQITLTVVSGNDQSGPAGLELPQPVVVQATDEFDQPIPGVVVNFVVATGGGHVFAGSALTDGTGHAADYWTLGPVAGTPQALEVRAVSADGTKQVFGSFAATALAGAPAVVMLYAGDGQSAPAGSAVPVAPAVRITDQFDNPVAGAEVAFAVTGGGGNVTGSPATSDNDGVATVGSWALGPAAGANALTATVTGSGIAGNPVIFGATGTSATATRLGIVVEPGSTAQAGVPFGQQPIVRLEDANGAPVAIQDVPVTVAVASGTGAGLIGTLTVLTDASGMAAFSGLQLDGLAGPFTLEFTAPGLAPVGSATIDLGAGDPDRLVLVTQPSDNATNGAPLARQPVVQVQDAFGNAASVAQIAVTASIQSGNGALSGTTLLETDAGGQAAFTDLAITGQTGNYTLAFSAPTLSGAASDPVVLAAGAAAAITLNGGDSQTAPSGSAVAVPPSVLVTDQSGNPVPDVMVTFAVTAGGGSVTGAVQLTSAGGLAAVGSWTLGSVGANGLSATASGGGIAGNPVLFTATATGNFWATRAPMPAPRRFGGNAVLNNLLYIFGGRDQGGTVRRFVDVYDPSTNTWSTRTSMPTARVGAVAGAINGLIYVATGTQANGNPTTSLEVFNPATNSWATLAPIPTARSGSAGAVLNGLLYVVGGALQGGASTNALQAYNPATNTWATLAPMPTARNDLAAAAVNGRLYVIGGQIGGGSSLVEIYDPGTNTWTTGPSMPTARYHLSAETYGGLVYVVGGILSQGSVTNVLEVLDPVAGSWATLAPMPTARSSPNVGFIGGVMYAIAGSFSGTATGINEAYTP